MKELLKEANEVIKEQIGLLYTFTDETEHIPGKALSFVDDQGMQQNHVENASNETEHKE